MSDQEVCEAFWIVAANPLKGCVLAEFVASIGFPIEYVGDVPATRRLLDETPAVVVQLCENAWTPQGHVGHDALGRFSPYHPAPFELVLVADEPHLNIGLDQTVDETILAPLFRRLLYARRSRVADELSE